MPMYAAVRRGRAVLRQHCTGDEFLAANSLQIPALVGIFEAANRPQEDFNARSSPFAACSTILPTKSYLFGLLPEELRGKVHSQSSSKDIVNLRLNSRTFRHLTTTLWHDLMKKGLPWTWEAWDDRPYPAFACTTRNEFAVVDTALYPRLEALNAPGVDQQTMIEAHSEHKKGYDEFLIPRPVQRLHRLETDSTGSTVRSIGSGRTSRVCRIGSVSGRLLSLSSAEWIGRKRMFTL